MDIHKAIKILQSYNNRDVQDTNPPLGQSTARAINGPETVMCTFPNLNVLREVTYYRLSGAIYTQFYAINGKLHRDSKEGPARTDYHENGQLAVRQYRESGIFHRDPLDGPAYECWHENGVKANEFYYVHGKQVKPPKIDYKFT